MESSSHWKSALNANISNFRHGLTSLFGWHTVPADAKEIVLTADEFDAMAVYQATSFPAVSLPLGLSSLPPEVWTTMCSLHCITDQLNLT